MAQKGNWITDAFTIVASESKAVRIKLRFPKFYMSSSPKNEAINIIKQQRINPKFYEGGKAIIKNGYK